MADMNGQVALVTGGTRGIGLAICERLINRGVTVAAGYAGRHDHARSSPRSTPTTASPSTRATSATTMTSPG